MTDKPTPEEVLEIFGQPSEGRYGSWHTQLVEALREAIRQRDEAREEVVRLREILAQSEETNV